MRQADERLKIEVVKGRDLAPDKKAAIVSLCNRAYDEDLEPLFRACEDPTHVIGYLDGRIISHALWVTRWLSGGNGPLLRTAFVEMVATEPEFQGQGFA